MGAFEADYRSARVTAKDIVLPPFLGDQDENSRSSILSLSPESQKEEERKSTLRVIEEEPLEGIPFIQEPSKTPQIAKKPQAKESPPMIMAKPNSSGSLPRSASTTQLDLISDSYFSTPNFIKRLCELSDGLIPYMENRGRQMEFCQQELKKINKHLPAAVYLPFVNESCRNYAVLHIVSEEAKIFRTKERCPLMLLIEAYRPTEIALENLPEILKVHKFLQGEKQANVFQRPTPIEMK